MSLAFDDHYQPTDMPARFRYAVPYGEEEARAPIIIRNGFTTSQNTTSSDLARNGVAGILNVLAWASLAVMLGGLAAVFFSTNAVAAAVLPVGLIALTIVGFIAKRRDAKG